jgi:predicted nucleic acid-binding protein
MKDRIFIDTNLLIYYVSNDILKKAIVKDLLIGNDEIVVSSQVITEFVSITIKKQILSREQSINYANEFMDIFEFAAINKSTIKLSFEIINRYGYSSWDSLIIASALENNCLILYTEDMQHNQIIGGILRIINPFRLGET